MNNESTTTFFDRLPSVQRQRSNGKFVSLDGIVPFSLRMSNDFEERKDDANLEFGKGAKVGITIHDCSSNKLLEARVDHDIDHVSADGKTVMLPFTYTSLSSVKKATRFFSLTFFDEAGARRFFETFQSFLPAQKSQALSPLHPTYNSLVTISKAIKDRMTQEREKDNAALVEGKRIEEEVEVVLLRKVEDKLEVEVLSDAEDQHDSKLKVQVKQEPPRKRKRLDPELENSKDPIHLLNQEFDMNQFGESQLY